MGLDPQQLAQRTKGLCEHETEVCPGPATLIVTPVATPLASRRLCAPHGEPFREEPTYHVGEIRPRLQ